MSTSDNSSQGIYLYGASGHAKVVLDVLRACGRKVAALVDDNPDINELCGHPVLHGIAGVSPVIVTIGNCAIRRRVAESLDCTFATAIHPSAIIAPDVCIGEGSVVMAGAILQPEVVIGRHCIINTKASLDHECRIGDYVHIAPGCTLSGDVHVGDGTWIGVGATVIQGVRIGSNCFIGAGAVVVSDIPDNTLAYGVPCRQIDTRQPLPSSS